MTAAVLPLRRETTAVELFADVRDWTKFMKTEGLGERTRRNYAAAIRRVLFEIAKDPREVSEDDLVAYLEALPTSGPGRVTIKRATASFYTWAVRRRGYPLNPAAEFRTRRSPEPPVTVLGDDEIARIVYAAAWRDPRRAWAIILTLETGGRIGSVAGILPDDAPDEAGRWVTFRVAKGDRRYSIPLTPNAADAVRELKAWRGRRARRTLIGVGPSMLWNWYHTAAVDAEIPPEKRKTHVLRHTCATVALRSGADIQTVRALLNHADLSTLRRYLARDDKRLEEAMSRSIYGRGAV